jgi:cysteine synthase B
VGLDCFQPVAIQGKIAQNFASVARMPKNYSLIESQIGNTPLVRLARLPGQTSNTILVKLEGNNPAGSVKDRPAYNMIVQAEARGDIKPGDTLIEATSGNTGIALAMVCAVKGYKLTRQGAGSIRQSR